MLITADIPDELVPWIAEVFAETYPQITAGLSPSSAIKAVMVSWVRSTLTTYEAEKARSLGDDAVAKVAEERDHGIEKARKKAWDMTEQLAVAVDPGEPTAPTA